MGRCPGSLLCGVIALCLAPAGCDDSAAGPVDAALMVAAHYAGEGGQVCLAPPTTSSLGQALALNNDVAEKDGTLDTLGSTY